MCFSFFVAHLPQRFRSLANFNVDEALLGTVPHSLIHVINHGLLWVLLDSVLGWMTQSWIPDPPRVDTPEGLDAFQFAQSFQQMLVSYQFGLTLMLSRGISTVSCRLIRT